MDDFELHDRPDIIFVLHADDILEYESLFPEVFVFLREHGMERLSFDQLEQRWQVRRHFPTYQHYSDFFTSIPAMRRASMHYAQHKETYNQDIVPHTRFFSQEFL
jgi:hypothetical protein